MTTTKMFWMGEDIETMSRERLIEVVRHLAEQLDDARIGALSTNRAWASLFKSASRS